MTNPSEDKTADAPQRPQRVDRMARLETIPRLNEEKRTLEAMVASFCHAHHGTKKGGPCEPPCVTPVSDLGVTCWSF